MRGFVLDRYELNPSKLDQFPYFFVLFSKIQKNDPRMKHFSTFSQRPSPQAPWDPPSGQELVSLVSWDKVSSQLDKMAPQLCPFPILEICSKPRFRFLRFRLLRFLGKPQPVRFRRFWLGLTGSGSVCGHPEIGAASCRSFAV